MKGTLSTNHGCCPVCGSNVLRTHTWNGTRLSEHYACRACGDTVYEVERAGVSRHIHPGIQAFPIPA